MCTFREYLSEVKIPKTAMGGDCYAAAGHYLMDNQYKNPKLLLVHGEATGQGPIAGIKHGHAWIEDGENVIEVSMGRHFVLPKELYYAVGNIDESKVFKYTPEAMRRKVLAAKHWGPWDLNVER